MTLATAALLSGLTGFLALSYEILWVRVHSFATGGEANAFGDLLGAYLVGIAIGSFLARRACSGDLDPGHDRAKRALWVCVALATALGFLLIPAVAELVRHVHPGVTLPLYALVAALQGTALPLLAHAAIPADAAAGAKLARIYVANIVGCAAGSLLTGFVLADVFPLPRIAALLAVFGFLLSGFLALSARRGDRRAELLAPGMLVVLPLLAWAVADDLHEAVYEKLQMKADYRPGFRFETVIETKSGVIAVTQDHRVYGGGAYDGGFNVDPLEDQNGITRAYAIAALHPDPKSVLMIGLGSGAWAQVVANHPSVERFVVVEINPGYVELLRRYPLVKSLLSNPKVSIVVDDGRRFLHHRGDRYDLVVQNTTHHWRAHITNLLSQEYLELVRDHLRPGGVYHSNSTGSPHFQKTAATVFPFCRRFRNFIAVSDSPMQVSAERVQEVLRTWTVDGRIQFPEGSPGAAERFEEILGKGDWEERDAILRRTASARIVTDDNMATEWALWR